MKKILISIILVFSMLMTGCNVSDNADADKISIITSFYPIYIFTSNIIKGAEGVSLKNLTGSQTGCLHDYQLLPEDMRLLESSDIFVINGAGMESFMDKITGEMKSISIVDSSTGISLIEDNEHEHEEENIDHHEHKYNAHLWLSVKNAIVQVENIANGLCKADEANANIYKENANKYIEKLKKLDEKLEKETANLSKRDIITFHEAFPYFAEEYGLNIVATVRQDGENEPGPSEIAHLVELIKEKNITAIFTEPQYSPKSAETVAAETGALIYSLDPIVTGNFTDDAYEKAMEENLNVISKALK